MKPLSLAYGCAAVALVSVTAWPSPSAKAAQLSELPSVLVIAKSSNKNEVHYAAAVDDGCAPAGRSPVRPYWRMLERGPGETEPLTDREAQVLGIERQSVDGDTIDFALRGMSKRTFSVHTLRAPDGRCGSWVGTTIAGEKARLSRVYVQQKWLGSVDYVLLGGVTENGKTVEERVSP